MLEERCDLIHKIHTCRRLSSTPGGLAIGLPFKIIPECSGIFSLPVKPHKGSSLHHGGRERSCRLKNPVSLSQGVRSRRGRAVRSSFAETEVHGEGLLHGPMDSLHPLGKSSDSLWPEGRQVRVIKMIQALGHVCVRGCADRKMTGQDDPGDKTHVPLSELPGEPRLHQVPVRAQCRAGGAVTSDLHCQSNKPKLKQ